MTDGRTPPGPVTRTGPVTGIARASARARVTFGAPSIPAPGSTANDLATRLDALRVAVGEVEVLSTVTTGIYDGADWSEVDQEVVDRVACLLGLISRSATAAMAAFHRLHAAVADAQPVPAGERWEDEGAGSTG